MRSKSALLAVLSIVMVIASACGAQAAPGQSVPAYGQPSAAIPATGATNTVAAPPTSMPPATQPPSGSSSGAAQLALAQNPKFGSILADDKGMTLYMYTKDTPNTSNCYGGCAKAWPPLLAPAGGPAPVTGLDASKLGTTTRTDGTIQATYNGWPLYYYAKDKQPGDVVGQNVGSVWFVLSASGDPIK